MKLRKQRGFTLIEVVVASTLAAGTFFMVSAGTRQFMALSQQNRVMGSAQQENLALKSMIAGIPLADAVSIICPFPHPYMRFNAATGACERGRNRGGSVYIDPSPTQMAAWRDLSNALFNWTENEPYDTVGRIDSQTHTRKFAGQPLPNMNPGEFASLIRTRLQTAGCIDCHDGTFNPADPVMGLDFRNLNPLLNARVVSRHLFTSSLGRRLLQPQHNLQSLFPRGRARMVDAGVPGGEFPVVSHQVNFMRPGVCDAADEVERSYNSPTLAAAQCPGNCPPGEYEDPLRCAFWCSQFSSAVSSSSPTDCTRWTTRLTCYVPRTRCAGSPACAGGRVVAVGSCLENQSSAQCGRGSTTWRCVSPMDPTDSVGGIVQYNVITVHNDRTLGTARQYVSEGALR